jgi:uncharacterized damage-inducible protein DinB
VKSILAGVATFIVTVIISSAIALGLIVRLPQFGLDIIPRPVAHHMVENRAWFERHFESGLHEDRFPGIVERLRGTPARLEERLSGTRTDLLTHRPENKWSIQENAGHLWDLEPLWAARLDDLIAGVQQLRAADLQNRKTHEAQHNARPLAEILAGFRRERSRLVARLEILSTTDLRYTAVHPRLHQPMTGVDLFFFVAEHDDHHLATISQLFRTLRSSGT